MRRALAIVFLTACAGQPTRPPDHGQPGSARPSASLSDDGQPGSARPSASLDVAASRAVATRLIIENPTVDALDIWLGPEPRGSIPPAASTTLVPIRPGRWTLTLESARSGLSETFTLVLGANETQTVTATRQLTALRIDNPHVEPVEVAIDGVVYGVAAAGTSTLIHGAPAGKRLIVLKSMGGPGAIRIEKNLPVGPISLEVPPLAGPVVTHELPRPPDGKGLVRMRNESRFAATLYIDGIDRGLVEAGGLIDVVLAPGEHHLEVRLEGLDAKTEHRVTLRPNQAAEWTWGGP